MKKLTIILALTLTIFIGSCSQLLDVAPRQSIDTTVAMDSPELVQAAITNTYTYLKSISLYGRDLLAISECLADDARIINRAGGRFVNEGNNVPNSHMGGWGTYYVGINEINLILQALPTRSFYSQAQKDAIEGEVKFLRALFYFNLARVYAFDPKVIIAAQDQGGVPLMLSGVNSPSDIQYPARASVQEVYGQIYKDLTDAVAKAPTTRAPSRATKGAAQALFARVALYNGDWDNAVKYATDALASGVGRFVPTNEYVSAWRANSHPESIFEVLYQTRQESLGVNDALQSAYSSMASVAEASALASVRPSALPPASGWGAVVPTTALLNLHPTGDVRRQLYQDGLNRGNSVVTECTKFLGKTGVLYMDNVPVIRVSELHLIRAEALARSNKDLVTALSDINRIRTRAGLTALTNQTTTQIITEVMLQRRLELAFEGHRWFDLKRLGLDITKSTGNLPYGDYRILAPLPLSEVQANPKMKQNAGY
jgi:hypothetical protein